VSHPFHRDYGRGEINRGLLALRKAIQLWFTEEGRAARPTANSACVARSEAFTDVFTVGGVVKKKLFKHSAGDQVPGSPLSTSLQSYLPKAGFTLSTLLSRTIFLSLPRPQIESTVGFISSVGPEVRLLQRFFDRGCPSCRWEADFTASAFTLAEANSPFCICSSQLRSPWT
jgi:hypothetical protein